MFPGKIIQCTSQTSWPRRRTSHAFLYIVIILHENDIVEELLRVQKAAVSRPVDIHPLW